MAAVTETTIGGGPSSPTGYEAFLKDSNETFDMAKIQEKSPSPPVVAIAEKAPETPEESWTASITTGAQSVMTNYFPPKSPCGDKALSPFSEVPDLAASSSSEKSGLEVAEESSTTTKGGLSDWAEKMSSTCNMETPCGKLDIEFMQKEEPKLPPKGNELSEQGELLAIEGGPPPKPWTEELSDKVQEAQTAVSTKANGLFVALGLFIKKDQALMTDFYNATSPKEGEAPKEGEQQPEEKPVEKSLSEKMHEVQTTVSQTAQSVSTTVTSTAQVLFDTGMSTLGECTKGEENKEKKDPTQEEAPTAVDPIEEATTVAAPNQEATTVAAPNQEATTVAAPTQEAPTVAAPTQEAPTEAAAPSPEIPAVESIASIATEPTNATPKDEEKKESSPSWNLWKQIKGFMGKFKLPEKTPTCEVPTIPKVELPPCTAPSKIEIPSCGVFSFIPQTFEKEPTTTEEAKVEETKKAENVKVEEVKAGETKKAEEVKVEEFKEKTEELKVKIEETNKAEEPTVVSPKESALPW